MNVEKKDLALEIACALKDVFVAIVEAEDEAVTMKFTNGQKFRLEVQEV